MRCRTGNWRVRAIGLILGLTGVFGPSVGLGAPAAPVTEYRFAPGDMIEVSVTPQKGFDRTLTVQPDGKITYPIVGQLLVTGLSVSQLVEQLQTRLNEELVDPIVSVSLREAGRREAPRISLLGAVRAPGPMEIKEGATLAQAVAAAGGPGPRADLRRVTITGAGGATKTVDLSEASKPGGTAAVVTLQPGDVVTVPEAGPTTILVLGAVEKPGSFEIQPGARLLDAIAQAGGMTTKADLRRVSLGHQGTSATRTVDLQPLLLRGDTSNPELNPALQSGDSVFIPETAHQIYVLGSVARPGSHAFKPGDRVLEALVNAGGAGGGSLKAVLVRRGTDGQPVARTLNLKKVMARGDAAENVPLEAGDTLFVPEKSDRRRSAQDYLSLIFSVSGLFSLWGR